MNDPIALTIYFNLPTLYFQESVRKWNILQSFQLLTVDVFSVFLSSHLISHWLSFWCWTVLLSTLNLFCKSWSKIYFRSWFTSTQYWLIYDAGAVIYCVDHCKSNVRVLVNSSSIVFWQSMFMTIIVDESIGYAAKTGYWVNILRHLPLASFSSCIESIDAYYVVSGTKFVIYFLF
jgi:hypothetical protein